MNHPFDFAPKVSVADLSRDDMAEAVEDAFRMGRMVVAAASYDGHVFPPMHDFLHHLQMKGYRNRRVAVIENGSWAPTAAKVMKKMLENSKEIEFVENVVTVKSALAEENKAQLEALAAALV